MRIKGWLLWALLLQGCGKTGIPQPLFIASGRVLSAQGTPLAGAVVTDGLVSVLSQEDGGFTLGAFRPTLSISKPGYLKTSLSGESGAMPDVSLGVASGAPRVALDTRWAASDLIGFRQALTQRNLPPAPYPATPLSAIDVLFIITPGALSFQETQAIDAWVAAGGRLIICGEWGGYPSQSLGALNALAAPAGITFTGATIKENGQKGALADWLTLDSVLSPSLSRLEGALPLALFTTTSLQVKSPAIPLLQSDSHSYTVQGISAPPVIGAVGPSGLGKVFALGDSSLWRDTDSGQAGKPNWQKQGNLQLALAFLGW